MTRKSYIDLALSQPDRTLGLRTVTTGDLLRADRKIWGTIAELYNTGWSLDEALHEVTVLRNDVASLLILRPQAPGPGKGEGKKRTWEEDYVDPSKRWKGHGGKPTKGPGKGKPKGSKPQPNPAWAAMHKGKPICRFQTGHCKSDKCAYEHVCVVKQSGRPSGSEAGPHCTSRTNPA